MIIPRYQSVRNSDSRFLQIIVVTWFAVAPKHISITNILRWAFVCSIKESRKHFWQSKILH